MIIRTDTLIFEKSNFVEIWSEKSTVPCKLESAGISCTQLDVCAIRIIAAGWSAVGPALHKAHHKAKSNRPRWPGLPPLVLVAGRPLRYNGAKSPARRE